MAINFPDSPQVNDVYIVGFTKYIYDGEKWKKYAYGIQDVKDAVTGAAPDLLDTLDEIAGAIGDDASFAVTVANTYATKAEMSNGDSSLSGAITALEEDLADGLDTKVDIVSTVSIQSADVYTLILGDERSIIKLTNVTATEVTVPPTTQQAFPVGTVIELMPTGGGDYTVKGATGVTVLGNTIIQHYAKLVKSGADEWIIVSPNDYNADLAEFHYGSGTFSGSTTQQVNYDEMSANTFITVIPTSEKAGTWSVESFEGYFIITSTDSETTLAPTFNWNAVKKAV